MKFYTKIPNEIFENNQLSLATRYLYSLLLKFCGKDDYCFPGQKKLSIIMNISERQVRNLLNELERSGLIYKTRRGWNRSNNYKVAKSLQIDRKHNSFLIGSKFPLHEGNIFPPKSTYLKGKDKRSIKGLEKTRELINQMRSDDINNFSYK